LEEYEGLSLCNGSHTTIRVAQNTRVYITLVDYAAERVGAGGSCASRQFAATRFPLALHGVFKASGDVPDTLFRELVVACRWKSLETGVKIKSKMDRVQVRALQRNAK